MSRIHYEYIPDEPSERASRGPCAWCRNGAYIRGETKIACRKHGGKEDPRREYSCFEKHPTRTLESLEDNYRWYILTAICDILKIEFTNDLYVQIKKLIELVRDDQTKQSDAISYDIVGVQLAVNLYRDQNSVQICQFLLTNYLTKVYLLIKENKQEEAIQVYKDMVTFLFIRYRNAEDYSNLINSESFENPKTLIK